MGAHCIQQIARTVTVHGRNGHHLVKAEVVELVVIGIRRADGVHLVDRQHDRLARAQQHIRDLLIGSRQAGLHIRQENDDVRVLNGDLRLLALVGFALYLQIFKLLLPVLSVVAGISVQTAIFKLINCTCNRSKKCPVMGHHNYSLGIVNQIILQPLHRFHVQMVSRLIQKQKIRLL